MASVYGGDAIHLATTRSQSARHASSQSMVHSTPVQEKRTWTVPLPVIAHAFLSGRNRCAMANVGCVSDCSGTPSSGSQKRYTDIFTVLVMSNPFAVIDMFPR